MKINLVIYYIAFISTPFLFIACSEIPKSFKEITLDDMSPILSEEQYQTLKSFDNDDQIKAYLDKYWSDNNPIPGAERNELKIEYLRRLEYANNHYPDHQGWGRSDRKRIYLVYGPPIFIDRYELSNIDYGSSSLIKSFEVWCYGTTGKNTSLHTFVDNLYPGEKKFIFTDITGCGIYKLLYSSEDFIDIDLGMYIKY
jgi:GWxTD domain-containing protein